MNTPQDPAVYVDPFPGRKGDELVEDLCGKCGGDGLYKGPTGIMIRNPRGGGNFPGCLACGGYGSVKVKVSSVRARDRKAAKRAQADRDAAPLRQWLAAKNAWESDVRAWLKAEKEHARRAALVTGFIGDIGAKVADLVGTVTAAFEYETTTYRGHDTTGRILIITLDDGHVVKWMSATAAGIWGCDKGDRVRVVRAAVKDHTNYRGQDQTELKNVKLETLDSQH